MQVIDCAFISNSFPQCGQTYPTTAPPLLDLSCGTGTITTPNGTTELKSLFDDCLIYPGGGNGLVGREFCTV